MDATPLYLLTSLALVGSPGPNTMSLTAVGAAFGPRRGVPYMLGLDLGMVAVVALVGSGLWAAILAYPGLAPVIAVTASAYLLYLAFRIATAPTMSRSDATRRAEPRGSGPGFCCRSPIPRPTCRWQRWYRAPRCCRGGRWPTSS